ncbi:MAG: cyclase family protein [Chloroflexota bacterium]
MNAKSTKLIDLSHSVEEEMITYKGLPAPIICDYLSREASREVYAPGTEFHIGKIELVGNTGTYVDAPFHRFADGLDLSELPLESLVNLDTIVVRVTEEEMAIDVNYFQDINPRGKAILVHTGWSRHWRTDQYFENHPYLTEASAHFLRDNGAALVGIDSLNIDSISNGQRPVHTVLLGANIPIAEHLTNLDQVPDTGFRFYAAPVKVKNMGTFPVRAFAMV